MASKRSFFNQDFLARVREYLPMDASFWETDAEGNAVGQGLSSPLSDNTFYIFDAESLLSLSYAIEDEALEQANGSLLAAFQQFKNFEPHRERYWQLAATIDHVQVVATGKTPRQAGCLQFHRLSPGPLAKYWIVLYQGAGLQVLLYCRQCHDHAVFEKRKFHGFYTFDPAVIKRVHAEILNHLGARRKTEPEEFRRLAAIDSAAKKLSLEFSREKENLESALRQLQSHCENFPEPFLTDCDLALERLAQWKSRLPKMLATTRK